MPTYQLAWYWSNKFMCASLAIATVRCQGAWSYRHLLRPTAHYHNLSSNMLPKIQLFESSATRSVNMLPWETFRHTRSTCCRQQVAGNLFPKSCPKVAAGNMLLATCCRWQHVASGNFRATFGQQVAGNLLPATCCRRQLSGNFWETCWRQHVAGNMLPECWPCVAGLRRRRRDDDARCRPRI